MEMLVKRAGIWLAVLLLAVLAMAGAADTPFAIQMGIVALAALIGLAVSRDRKGHPQDARRGQI